MMCLKTFGKLWNTAVRIPPYLTKIQTGCTTSTNQEHYRYTSLFGGGRLKYCVL
jgi:hypothetical protein